MDTETVIAIALSAGNLLWMGYSWRSRKRGLDADTIRDLTESVGMVQSQNRELWKRISNLEQENKKLRAGYNSVGQENVALKKRVATLESRLDTGDLTPPPHNVPSTWAGDPPPVDDPPNE